MFGEASINHAALVEISDQFCAWILEGYAAEPQWTNISDIIDSNNSSLQPSRILYRKNSKRVIFYDNPELDLRLCIPDSEKQTVLRLAYDDLGHPGYHRFHKRITSSVYLHNLGKEIREYIQFYPDYHRNPTKRHKPDGQMQPIMIAAYPFHAITIDFILTLPLTPQGYSCIMSITCKFSKAVTFVPGKITWTAEEWATQLLDRLSLLNWGLPRVIINDQDSKFVAEV